MQGMSQKHLSFCTFLDSFPHSSFDNTKKAECYMITSYDSNGTIILNNSFEQRSFILKIKSDCKSAINY